MKHAADASTETVLDKWTAQARATILKYWYLFLLGGAVAALAGYSLSFTQPVVYRATATAVSAEQVGGESLGVLGQLRGLTALAGIEIGGMAENSEAIATLRSRKFSEEFMRDAGISRKVCELHCASALADPEDADRLRIRSVLAFESKVRRIEEDRQLGVVRVSIVWPDRAEAAVLANRMFASLNELLRARARSEAEASLQFLHEELGRTSSVEMRQALFSLVERQTARIMAANVTADFAYRVIDPAMVPDEAMPESPRRIIWALLSSLAGIGLLFGLLIALGRGGR